MKSLQLGAYQLLFWLLSRVAAGLPRSIVANLGYRLGDLAYWLAPRRRKIARINLTRCFPEQSASAREALVKEHFRYYGRGFIERFAVWTLPEAALAEWVQIENQSFFEALRGQPVIILAPHFLGLDAGGVRFQIETRFVSMYARQSNPVLDQLTLQGRSRFNDPVLLARQDGLRQAVKLLRQGLPFYFLPDMDLGARDGVFASFFGVKAATVNSVSRLARLTGAVVLPCVTTMTDAGYRCRFYPPWLDFPKEDDLAAAEYMNRFIEERVQENPAQYLWTHKRFKTRPEGEPGFYDQR